MVKKKKVTLVKTKKDGSVKFKKDGGAKSKQVSVKKAEKKEDKNPILFRIFSTTFDTNTITSEPESIQLVLETKRATLPLVKIKRRKHP